MRQRQITLILILGMLILAVPAFAAATDVVVRGEAKVSVAPDIGHIALAIETRGETAQDAQLENARLANQVIEAIKKLELAKKIETSNFSLYANYDYNTNTNVGYTASNQILVSTLNLDKLGTILDAAIAAGANRINYISFGLQDESAAFAEALTQAVGNAQNKALVIAKALGAEITGVKQVVETGANAIPLQYRGEKLMMAEATPIAAGNVEVMASVEAVFDVEVK